MSGIAISICIACQFLLVAGQVFLKHAMGGISGTTPAPSRAAAARNFALGIGCLTAWFFLWLGILEQCELSNVFPFEGLNPALLVLAAWLFLKERISVQAWIGVLVICGGIMLVAMN